jgi:hypothetical protein
VAVAIVVLVLWIATAAAGVTLLRAGGAARRAAAAAAIPAEERKPVPVRIGAIPMTEDGKPPPLPNVRVVTPEGEHPLLEFSHPMLAVTGLAFWAMFAFVHYRPLAWIAFGIVIVTIGIGLGWLARNRQADRQHRAGAWRFPPRLVALHGLSATLTIVLAVLSALAASRG